jgi:hypothetical protein
MDPFLLVGLTAVALIIVAIVVFIAYNLMVKKPVEDLMMQMAGELKLNFYSAVEGRPPFATGTYSERGVTLDLLNEKGYADRWHPHARVVVSVNKNIKDVYIVAKRGRFYSRKLGEIRVPFCRFDDKYTFLSSSPQKAEKIMTNEIAGWIMALEMPFILQDGHIEYHQDRPFDDVKRIKHIIDALVYIANVAERVK